MGVAIAPSFHLHQLWPSRCMAHRGKEGRGMATEAGLHFKKPSSLQMQAAKGWEDRKAQLLGQRSHVPPVRTAIELQLHEMRGRGCANTCLRPKSSDKAPRVCGSPAVCEQGRQAGRVAGSAVPHTPPSLCRLREQTPTLGGRAKLRCPSTCLPTLDLCASQSPQLANST